MSSQLSLMIRHSHMTRGYRLLELSFRRSLKPTLKGYMRKKTYGNKNTSRSAKLSRRLNNDSTEKITRWRKSFPYSMKATSALILRRKDRMLNTRRRS